MKALHRAPRGVLVSAALCIATALVGCNSLGIGVTIPIGPVGVTIGGSIPLPQRSAPQAPDGPASAASSPTK